MFYLSEQLSRCYLNYYMWISYFWINSCILKFCISLVKLEINILIYPLLLYLVITLQGILRYDGGLSNLINRNPFLLLFSSIKNKWHWKLWGVETIGGFTPFMFSSLSTRHLGCDLQIYGWTCFHFDESPTLPLGFEGYKVGVFTLLVCKKLQSVTYY